MAATHTSSQQAENTTFTFYTALLFINHNGDLWEYKQLKKKKASVITFAESLIIDQAAE